MAHTFIQVMNKMAWVLQNKSNMANGEKIIVLKKMIYDYMQLSSKNQTRCYQLAEQVASKFWGFLLVLFSYPIFGQNFEYE
jgi:hypothetical protein